MKTVTDQMNSTIRLESAPSRIVSLVPSQTQLLHYLGLEDEVVGITKFCIQPDEWFRTKNRVGGTKSVDIEKVKALTPDIIIGNKEENSIEDIEALKKIAPVWMSDIYTLDDALEMISSISKMTERSDLGEKLIQDIQLGFEALNSKVFDINFEAKSVLYFIWNEPTMISGKNTFVDNMLSKCGLINATNESRYPEIKMEDYSPNFVFLSSEPFPYKENHVAEYQSRFPDSKVILVDGEMFSWYGSKLKNAPSYFSKLLDQLA